MSTKDYQHKFNGVISPLGAVMNVLILALIYKKSTTAMANYRKVLLLSSYFDFAMSIYFWLFAPSTGVSKGYYYVVCNGVLGPMPPTFSCVSFMILMWLIYGNVANLAVQYLYRYLALCRNIHMSKLQFTVVVLIGWTPVFTYDIFNLFRYGLSINPNSTLPITILQNTEWDDGNNFPSFVGVFADVYIDIFVKINMSTVVFFYSIVITTMVLVLRALSKLSSNTHLSKQTLQAHRQLTFILLFEAFLPLNTIVLPIVVDNAGINGIPLPSLAFFSLNMVIAAPLLTAIVKVLTIKTFRQYVFSYFKNAGRVQSNIANTTIE